MTKPTTLYRYFDADGDLLYVGISSNPIHRMSEHRRVQGWWSEIVGSTFEHFPDRESAATAERQAIAAESPRYNIMGRPLVLAGEMRAATSALGDHEPLPLEDADPVGAVEIAERLNVKRRTVDQWRARPLDFPEPRWTVGGRPAWNFDDVEAWAKRTGRGA